MKGFLENIYKWGRATTIMAGAGWGVSNILDSLGKISKMDPKTISRFNKVCLKIFGIAAGTTCMAYTVKKVADTQAYKAERLADADRHARERQTEADCYVKERQADADLYTIQKQADERLIRAKAEAGVYRNGKSSNISSDNGNTGAVDGSINDGLIDSTDETTQPYELVSYSQLNENAYAGRDLWYVEGIVAVGLVNWILGGSGIGKSTLMIQILVAVSTGKKVEFLPDDSLSPRKTTVVFYRLENFETEYSGKYGDGKVLDESGIKWRNPNKVDLSTYQKLHSDLEKLVEVTNEDLFVGIDPLTKLPDFDAGKFAEDASKLLKRASEKGIRLTFLCSAHLDEVEPWKPITTADIKGGDRLIQTAGSVFAIRYEGTDYTHRYIKILKPAKGYAGDDKVLVCKTVPGENFLHCEYVCHKTEAEALPKKPKAEGEDTGKKTTTNSTPPKRSPKIEWTEGMVSRLKELFDAGTNDNQIAQIMSEEFEVKLAPMQIARQLEKQGLRPSDPSKIGG